MGRVQSQIFLSFGVGCDPARASPAVVGAKTQAAFGQWWAWAKGGPTTTPQELATEAVARVEGVTGKTATPKVVDQAVIEARKLLG